MDVAEQPPRECDIAVIGGGIVGLAVARELLRRESGARLCVLEAESDPGRHQTSHSSGVVHAGIYYPPGSLKARLCVEGARELYAYCEERGIPYRLPGKLILATADSEIARLDELERRGRANRVPDLRRLAEDEIGTVEPNARGVAALHSPRTGIVDFGAVAVGRVLIGPSALLAPARDAYRLSTFRPRDLGESLTWPGTWRMAARNWRAGLREIRHAASRRAFAAEAIRAS